MNKEIWKDIIGYEKLYQVSNLGNIRSLYNYRGKFNVLKPQIKKGYYTIGLRKNSKRKWHSIHKLVADAFILDKTKYKSMPYEDRSKIKLADLQVNHKDEDKLNNNANNLEWCTVLYNNCYGTRLQRVAKTNKLKKKIIQYNLDKQKIAVYESLAEASRITKTNISCISGCINHKRKTANNCIWVCESEVV